MASANSKFDDILTSTLINRDGATADNVSNHNSLLRFLRKAGNITMYDGGSSLIQNVDFAENTTFSTRLLYSFDNYDGINPQHAERIVQDVVDAIQLARFADDQAGYLAFRVRAINVDRRMADPIFERRQVTAEF